MWTDTAFYWIGVCISLGASATVAAALAVLGMFAWFEIASGWRAASVFKPRPKGVFNTRAFIFASRLRFAAKWACGERPQKCFAPLGTQGGSELVFDIEWLRKD